MTAGEPGPVDAAPAAPSDRFPVSTSPGCAAPLIVGVTAHRNLVEAEVAPLRARIDAFFDDLARRFPELPLVVLSALASGGDLLVAKRALARGLRVVGVLPLPAELYARDFGAAGRAAFSALCEQAEVLQVPLLSGNTQSDIAAHGEARDAQYAEAGVFIASHCHILLALWDGRPSDLTGGTAQTIRYQLEGVLPGSIGGRRDTRPLYDRGDESLVFHIACSREDTATGIQPPLPPLQPLQARWLNQWGSRAAHDGLPEEFARIFQRMVQFNVDARRYQAEIDAHAGVTAAMDSPAQERGLLGDLFSATDWLAVHFRKRVVRGMRSIHVLAALMGIAFVGYSDLSGDGLSRMLLLYLFLGLFAAGIVLDRVAKFREWHRKYIDYRALAEGLRVQHYWRRAGIVTSDSVAFAHDNFLQKQDIELGWIRNIMRAAGLRMLESEGAIDDTLDTVIEEWIGTAGSGGQLDYYTRRTDERIRVHRAAQGVSRFCLWSSITVGVVLAVFHRLFEAGTISYLVMAIGVLAIVATARESYAWRKADKELIKQYHFMRNVFAGARAALDSEADPQCRRDILGALGEAALTEHAEWALRHRERPLEHGKL